MRVVFAGTPAFAASALQALIDAHFDVALVLTQPDRPAGRGLRTSFSAVKQLALTHGLTIDQPSSLRGEELLARLRTSGAQAMVVAAYGLILPAAVLSLFPIGCINIHASLLPRWRGAAPIQRAILASDRETGISIMRMDQGLDTGPVYLTEALPILPDDTAGSLHDRLACLGARCIVDALPRIEQGVLVSVPQPSDGATYAQKVTKAEAAIDWRREAYTVDRQVRAFNPVPGAYSALGDTTVKIWRVQPSADGQGDPGLIMRAGETGIDVACGRGMVKILELQQASAKRLSAAEYARGASPLVGQRFES
jgi:methionyl-tRNA formyltransferase